MQIVITFDPACGVDERMAALVCAALDAQAQEFCGKHGIEYVPVNYYSWDVLEKLEGEELTKFTTDSYLVTVQTTMDVPNALGYHDDQLGVIFSRVLWQGSAGSTWITISHEILELLLDKTCDIYIEVGDGTEQAKEACDRVEGDSYAETGSIGDATTGVDSIPVDVSNYLLPSAFIPGSTGPWDRMNRLTSWNGMTGGGYMIVRDASGNENEVFAARVVPGGEAAHENIKAKKARPDSRLSRRLAVKAAA